MNNRILTPHERRVIEQYLENGERVMAIRVYLSRAKKSLNTLTKDLELLQRLIDQG